MAPLLRARVCLVTSSTHGYGYSIAKSLARYGANVIVHGKDSQQVVQALQTLPKLHDTQQHFSVVADLNKEKNFESMTKQVGNLTPHLDVLINNSGLVRKPPKAVVELPTTVFDDVVTNNLSTPFKLTQALAPLVLKGNQPSLMFISSEIEKEAGDESGAYYLSKFGFRCSHMLSSMFSQELGTSGVRVNAINPAGTYIKPPQSSLKLAKQPEPTYEQLTNALVWLSRADTVLTGATIDARDWANRDPTKFKYYY